MKEMEYWPLSSILSLPYVLFLLLIHYQVLMIHSSSSSPQCHPDEGNALLQFKSSFSINISASAAASIYCYDEEYNSKTASWDKSVNCCAWSGITCDQVTGHIISLDLSCSSLQGTIGSNSSLFLLRHLQRLDLSYNDFRGSPILSGFGQFKNLTHLDLSYSHFSGRIPLKISNLSKLVSLQIRAFETQNVTVGPSTFKALTQNLTSLRKLALFNIDMSSVPPFSLMNLSSSLTLLELGSCKLQGKLPENCFRKPNLQVLYLGFNEALTGSFPKSNWTSPLKVLDLSGSVGFSVDLPHLLNNAKSLSTLVLFSCSFVGSYPALLGNFTQIVTLDLSDNNFTGQIPWYSFSVLNRLKYLDLSSNNFIGQLPEIDSNPTQNFSSYNSSSLRALILFNNSLDGTIPSWIYALPRLVYLDLSSNHFAGEIAEFHSSSLSDLYLGKNNFVINGKYFKKLSKLKELEGLDLSSCNIRQFPHFLKSLRTLSYLDLSCNQINGSVPKWLWKVGKNSLEHLNLSHNSFTYIKPLPWNNLKILDLSSNLFSGPLPISSPLSQFYLVSKNQFSGEIPRSFCEMKWLMVLDLSYNNLSGEIQECMGNFGEDLSVFNLGRNKLHGAIPATCGQGTSLRTLNLNGNQLEGSLPLSLLTCKNLEVLDLGNNKINDTFPTWLGCLPMLQVLILSSNKFRGFIAYTKVGLPFGKLRIMDLSRNEFSGPLPTKYFETLMAMAHANTDILKYLGDRYYQDSLTIVVKGFTLKFEKILNIFTAIDFSENHFEGEIPESIGKLKSLKGLNFSENKLIGHIPPSLGNLSELEWLDLSSNKLAGEIPPQLADLMQLAKLNFSQNELVGPIPLGEQFNTFGNDSYSGNFGLCGFPLSKSCSKDEAPKPSPPGTHQESDDDHENEFEFWKVVMMGYGCGVVIGISVGYIVLSSNKVDYWIAKNIQGVGAPRRPKISRSRRGRN